MGEECLRHRVVRWISVMPMDLDHLNVGGDTNRTWGLYSTHRRAPSVLTEALDASGSELVFPDEKGAMRTRGAPLHDVLRRVRRAGIVSGYVLVCRRRGCGHREQHQAPAPANRRGPTCNMRLWPCALPRPLRFHDLRGTTATLLARAGVPLVVAQRILRHSDPRLTADVYSRVDLGDLRARINHLGIPAEAPTQQLLRAVASSSATAPQQPFVASLSYERAAHEKGAGPLSPTPRNLMSGRQDLNLRPLGPEEGSGGLYLVT